MVEQGVILSGSPGVPGAVVTVPSVGVAEAVSVTPGAVFSGSIVAVGA